MIFVNDNEHPIRVKDGNGALQRIQAGGAVKADGAYADRLSATNGVREGSDDDLATSEVQAAPLDHDRAVADVATAARQLAKQITVVGPLQRVIGDDQAPYGPPSGTVTTRQAVAQKAVAEGDQRTREAFADHDAVSKVDATQDSVPLSGASPVESAAVHNAQADAFDVAGKAGELYSDPEALSALGADVPTVAGSGGGEGLDTPSKVRKANKVQRQAEVERLGLEVDGTGADGDVTSGDLEKALLANLENDGREV